MAWRLGLLCVVASLGCTAIRPLDPVGGRDARVGNDGGGLDVGTDAATAMDVGPLPDTGPTPDTGAMPDTGSSPDAFVASDAGSDASIDTGPRDAGCPPEVCGGGDEDCDGMIDESDAIGAMAYYPDEDHDNYGLTTGLVMACARPPTGNWITRPGDCDDTNRQINPSRAEICNGLDDDCNGMIDDGLTSCSVDCQVFAYGGHSYLFCNATRARGDASAQCTSMGYHLVDIGDAAENMFVQTTAMTLGLGGGGGSGGGVWIGLTQMAPMSTTYLNTDGSVATYFNWDTGLGEPNNTGTCIRMRPLTGRWADIVCTNLYSYVCEAP